MRKILLTLFLVYSIVCQAQTKPKLVIGIVVDQMRWDYLYKFENHFSNKGFNRLKNDGHEVAQTFINYLPSFTAPGHASIYTGSVPALHGIIGNDWWLKREAKSYYCTEDGFVQGFFNDSISGKMSPRLLKATTITDELKLATGGKAKVFGISVKDRGAILPAGHMADGAFWLNKKGQFISSSYYTTNPPEWLKAFNQAIPWANVFDQGWSFEKNLSEYTNYQYDTFSRKGTVAALIPLHQTGYRIDTTTANKYEAIKYLPFGNQLIFDLGKECILHEGLGTDNITDFLCLSLSSTDYAGHVFGPQSVEMEDMYLQLDKQLANFLEFLDKHIGKQQYTVFLTADHGGAFNTSYMNSLNMQAGNFSPKKYRPILEEALYQKWKVKSIIQHFTNYHIYLNDTLVAQLGLNRQEIFQTIHQTLVQMDGVYTVVDLQNLSNCALPAPIVEKIKNGQNPQRSGDFLVLLEPGWYESSYDAGSTHGTWHPYDTHIPLLFYGCGVKIGKTKQPYTISDIVPTLATYLGIALPNACIGQPIIGVFE